MSHHASSSEWYTINDPALQPSHRRALLYIPPTYRKDVASPLIIAMHGKDQSPAEFESHTQLSNPEINNEAIVAYPEGIDHQWTGDPASPLRSRIDDIAFIAHLITHIQTSYTIATSRVFALGFSNGGGLTALLASDRATSSRIAAFAISSGAFYKSIALKEPLFEHFEPEPGRLPIPLLEFHGDDDPVIHYDGSTPDGATWPVREYFDLWVQRNGITADCQVVEVFGGQVRRFSWMKGEREVLVHYLVRGFGHGWPSRRRLSNDGQRRGPTVFDATPLVLEWFRGFELP